MSGILLRLGAAVDEAITIPSPADPAADVWVLDGLRMAWRLREFPGQMEPSTAFVRLLTPEGLAMPPDLEVGDTASLILLWSTTPDAPLLAAQVNGRISELGAEPDDDGRFVVEVALSSFLADLENLDVGDTPWPWETVEARVAHIAAAAGIVVERPTLNPDVRVRAQDVDRQTAADLLFETLAAPVYPGNSLPVVLPFSLNRYALAPLPRLLPAASLYSLALVGVEVRIVDDVVSTDPARHVVIPGDAVEVGGRWFKSKESLVNTWTMAGEFQANPAAPVDDPTKAMTYRDVAAIAARGPIARTVNTNVASVTDAVWLATWYGRSASTSPDWSVESFVWHLDLDPDAEYVSAFWPVADLSDPPTIAPAVTIAGLDPSLTPSRATRYTGRLIGAEIRVEDGRVLVEMTLLQLADVEAAGGVRCSDLAASTLNPRCAPTAWSNHIDPTIRASDMAAVAPPP